MLIKFLHLPLAKKIALLTAIFCFFACAVLTLASVQGNSQLIRHSTELFGESLAQQLSRDASNPLVKGDKLSLQSLLNKLVESPMVVRGAIYDVENRPIAEAGEPNSGLSFSASITFQDSIAGYAVITFDTESQQQQASLLGWQLIVLALLLASLIYCLSLIPARQLSATLSDLSQIARTPKQHHRANTQVAYRGEDELQQLARDIISGASITGDRITGKSISGESISSKMNSNYVRQTPTNPATRDNNSCAMLLVEIVNLAKLQQQSSQHTVELVKTFQQQLTRICKLYDGTIRVCRSNSFNARFYFSDDESSYPFRALCCAYLIQLWIKQWMVSQQSPMTIRIGLALHEGNQGNDIETELAGQQTIEQLLQLTQGIEEGLIASAGLYQHPSVQQRIEVTQLNDDSLIIDKLAEPYAALLDRQLKTLLNQTL